MYSLKKGLDSSSRSKIYCRLRHRSATVRGPHGFLYNHHHHRQYRHECLIRHLSDVYLTSDPCSHGIPCLCLSEYRLRHLRHHILNQKNQRLRCHVLKHRGSVKYQGREIVVFIVANEERKFHHFRCLKKKKEKQNWVMMYCSSSPMTWRQEINGAEHSDALIIIKTDMGGVALSLFLFFNDEHFPLLFHLSLSDFNDDKLLLIALLPLLGFLIPRPHHRYRCKCLYLAYSVGTFPLLLLIMNSIWISKGRYRFCNH